MSSGDPFEAMTARIRALKPSLAWRAGDPGWADRARAALVSAVGVVSKPWPEPALELIETTQEDGHRRIRVEFPSHQGWNGRGWLLIPDGVPPSSPAVVCLPGHGAGADAIVGLIEEPYQANFALQSVRRGWVTLAVEQPSFGSNRSTRDADKGSSCVGDSMAALLLGETITGWRVRDASAARRALGTLPEVDPARVAVVGISGGGLTALWSAALDPSFLAAGVSGYFCPMAHSILKFDHCPDNYVPGFALLMDVPDLAGLVAPRWLAVENGSDDPLFAAEGFKTACRKAERIFRAHGVPERFSWDLFNGDHVFNGSTLFDSFAKAFAQGSESI